MKLTRLLAVTLFLLGIANASRANPGLASLLADRFGSNAAKRSTAALRLASFESSDANCKLAWEIYKSSNEHDVLRQQFEKKIVSTTDRTSPYLWRYVGRKPVSGWALVIALHGGGHAPKEVNDNEWQFMFNSYYKDHPEAGGYIYLALRAPNDDTYGFYDDAISPLVEQLIKQFMLFGGVNPDRVYVLGASHGGYGAYVIGPKIPYRFAAVHAAAAAATDGKTMGENLRNVRFTSMVGEQDTAYERIDRGRKFKALMDGWRKQYGGFDADFNFPANTGHLVPDHEKVAEVLKYTRNPWPKTVVWTQSDSVLKRNYWVEAPAPTPGGHIEAKTERNTITVKSVNQPEVALWLVQGLVDLSKPISIVFNGNTQSIRVIPALETYCHGLELTTDPKLAAPVRVEIKGGKILPNIAGTLAYSAQDQGISSPVPPQDRSAVDESGKPIALSGHSFVLSSVGGSTAAACWVSVPIGFRFTCRVKVKSGPVYISLGAFEDKPDVRSVAYDLFFRDVDNFWAIDSTSPVHGSRLDAAGPANLWQRLMDRKYHTMALVRTVDGRMSGYVDGILDVSSKDSVKVTFAGVEVYWGGFGDEEVEFSDPQLEAIH